MAEQLLQALQCDNQLSVRYLMEWVVVIVLSRYPELLDDLFYSHLHHVSLHRVKHVLSFHKLVVFITVKITE